MPNSSGFVKHDSWLPGIDTSLKRPNFSDNLGCQGIPAGSADAIVAGAAVGAVVGLGVGAKDAIKDHKQEIMRCLLEKGYKIVGDGAQQG